MELSIVVTVGCEICALVGFLKVKQISPIDIHRQLIEDYGEKSISIQHVRKWCREFSEGRTNIHDKDRTGRLSVSDEKVKRILLEDQKFTLNDLALHIPEISHTTIHVQWCGASP
ncbi:unnamed protein product [Diabrotica balteata]|uniref:Mos1 transposase HTH domain-containing protein n=1 Tax=Diabrotica balteata TaxID=107213 RepID=A0A9N9SPA6_DIABA|nr:unnamed protein product [Diabrotica balteata]